MKKFKLAFIVGSIALTAFFIFETAQAINLYYTQSNQTGVASTTVSKDVVDVDMKLTKATTEEAFKAIEKMLKARRWNEHQV